MNLILSLYYYQRGIEKVPTFPAFLKVEVCRFCNVNCRYCEKAKDSSIYSLERYKQLIDKLKDFIFAVSLYDIGEPLHNPDLLEYIRYAHGRNVGTIISSSLSVEKSDDYWRDLVRSGLDRLIVAIDGISEGVYREYRTNGDLRLVMANLQSILKYKTLSKSDLLVEWQMLDLPWNKHEQQSARALARTMGLDAFTLKNEENTIRLEYAKLGITRMKSCILPYVVYIVDVYNRVRPCYKVYTDDVFVGNMNRENFDAIWNCEEMFRIRNKSKICRRSPCMTCLE